MFTVIARSRLPAAHLAGRPATGPARQGRRLDHRGRREAGGQPPDRSAVHRRRGQPAAAVLPEPALGGRRRLRPAVHQARATSGPESIVDRPTSRSLLTQVCTRSDAVGGLEGVDGSRPFCTGGGVGAVLSVIGPRDARGNVVHPTRVVSVNEPCRHHAGAVPGQLRGCAGRVRQVR